MSALPVGDLVLSIITTSFTLTMPILFAAIGEVYAERSGVLNMGIEGVMGLAALVSLWATFSTGSYIIGLVAAIIAGVAMGILHSFVTVKVGINQLITGLLIYTLSGGIADFAYRMLTAQSFPVVRPLQPVLFGQNILVYASFAAAIVLGLVLYKTTWGLEIRAVGENPEAADAAGINVNRVRLVCVILGAALAAVGGASLVLGYLGLYNAGDTLVAGRGWIAIVVVIFAGWNPYKAIAGSWLFGLGYAIASTFIGSGVFSSLGPGTGYFFLAIPYILAIVFIVVFHRGTKAPSSLTIPYKRK
jgi:simple sugar transport system permease protein